MDTDDANGSNTQTNENTNNGGSNADDEVNMDNEPEITLIYDPVEDTCVMSSVVTTDGVAGEPVTLDVNPLFCCDEGFAQSDLVLSMACPEAEDIVIPVSAEWRNP